MDDRKLISSGSNFEQLAGYSRVVVDGEWVFVSRTTGYDYSNMTISADLETQTRQVFSNLEQALARAGATLADVVRVHYYLTAQGQFEQVAPVFGAFFGEIRPAATAVICGLVDPAMKIEIEVTARLRNVGN